LTSEVMAEERNKEGLQKKGKRTRPYQNLQTGKEPTKGAEGKRKIEVQDGGKNNSQGFVYCQEQSVQWTNWGGHGESIQKSTKAKGRRSLVAPSSGTSHP